jgi:hypothetical protein
MRRPLSKMGCGLRTRRLAAGSGAAAGFRPRGLRPATSGVPSSIRLPEPHSRRLRCRAARRPKVGGLWFTCSGSITPWGTHLGAQGSGGATAPRRHCRWRRGRGRRRRRDSLLPFCAPAVAAARGASPCACPDLSRTPAFNHALTHPRARFPFQHPTPHPAPPGSEEYPPDVSAPGRRGGGGRALCTHLGIPGVRPCRGPLGPSTPRVAPRADAAPCRNSRPSPSRGSPAIPRLAPAPRAPASAALTPHPPPSRPPIRPTSAGRLRNSSCHASPAPRPRPRCAAWAPTTRRRWARSTSGGENFHRRASKSPGLERCRAGKLALETAREPTYCFSLHMGPPGSLRQRAPPCRTAWCACAAALPRCRPSPCETPPRGPASRRPSAPSRAAGTLAFTPTQQSEWACSQRCYIHDAHMCQAHKWAWLRPPPGLPPHVSMSAAARLP